MTEHRHGRGIEESAAAVCQPAVKPAHAWWPVALCFAVALVLLGFGIDRTGIAAAFTDPPGQVRAQDESIYANTVLTLAVRGGWLTPRFLGRFILYKPPLLAWLCGASVRWLGVSLTALRLPVLVASAFAATLLFVWVWRLRSITAGSAAVLLLVSNSLWHVLSRLCYTDMLLAASCMAALYVLGRDPRLDSRLSVIAFGAAVAAGVMAKSAAGLLPMLALPLYYMLSRPDERPTAIRMAQALVIAMIAVVPWHLYQLTVHRQWFWTEYVRIQLLGFGLHPPDQHAAGNHVLFYARGLWLTDPFLCLFALLGLPRFIAAVRARKPDYLVWLCWTLTAGLALLCFRYRNLPYLLYLVPALCVIASACAPLQRNRSWLAALLFLSGVFVCKATLPSRPWSLPFDSAAQPSAATLRDYCRLGRPNELIVVAPDDDFYSATLPVPRLRYCFIDPGHVSLRYAPHYAYLGIMVTLDQFANLPRWQPGFEQRLREWGLDSTEPVATAILAESDADVLEIIRTHPKSDFYLPEALRPQTELPFQETHRAVSARPGRFFLLARSYPWKSFPKSGWVLPQRW